MDKNKQLEQIDLRPYIIPIVLILAVFIISSIFTVRGIHNFYYRLLNEQSIQYAQNYARRLSESRQAVKIINDLLGDKLIAAGNTLALYEQEINNDILRKLAKSLDIDELYYYSPEGEILFSSESKYLGWFSYHGHPVDDFLKSDLNTLVEDIRPDSESGNLFKYSYVRTSRGFFQLGISAQKVNILLDAFETQNLLEEIAGTAQVDTICFIDLNFVIQQSSDPDLIGFKLENPEIKLALGKNNTYALQSEFKGQPVHQIYTPIDLMGNRVGTLRVTQTLNATERIVWQTTILGIIVVAIVCIAMMYVIYISYQRKKQLVHLAYHHSITELPNRRYLKRELERNDKPDTALLLIHIQNFTVLNHLHGFHFGDQVLQIIAKELNNQFGKSYGLYHFSGNRLAFYITTNLSREELIELTEEILSATHQVLARLALQGRLKTRIAIVEIDDPTYDPERIFTDASLTLVHHNLSEEEQYSFFSAEMEELLLREDAIEQALRDFLTESKSGFLWVEYQPILDLKTNKIAGFEALSRMRLASLGSISPVEFITIAERKQLITKLSLWVFQNTCQFLNRLTKEGFKSVSVAINISGLELLNSGFIASVGKIIEDNNIPPGRIEFEITESIILENFERVNEVLQELREIGIRISVDDFGTGYSSLARMEDFNIDKIKIDKLFVDKIISKDHSKLIIKEIIAMSHKLDLLVVAEGVETEEQKIYLREQNCDLIQGFLFSRSLTQDQALEKIHIQNK